MILDVIANPNVGEELQLRFHETGPARRIARVRAPLRGCGPETECDVTGWDAGAGTPVPAFSRPVEDSGDGLALIVYGGTGGIRLKPVTVDEPWDVGSTNQWGEAYLTIRDGKDLVYENDKEQTTNANQTTNQRIQESVQGPQDHAGGT